jgi:hypothetical protein
MSISLKGKKVRNIFTFFSRWKQPHVLPVIYVSFLALGALFSLLSILDSQSENAFLLGYSLERVLLGGGLLFLFLLFVALTIKLIYQPEWSRRGFEFVFKRSKLRTIIFLIAIIFLTVCWIALFLPSYRLARMAGYIDELKPVIIWLAIVSAITILLVITVFGKESVEPIVLENQKIVWAGSVVLALFILAGGFVIFTGIGVQHPEDYWYASGVPVLGLQILIASIAGSFMLWLEPKWKGQKIDLWICIGIWLITAWLWAREPLRPNFFMPDTAKNLMYPYSDSATFDIGSQFALIGQGLFNGQYFDRALYTAFITYLHMLFGQNIQQIATGQAVIFAVFPLVIYLLGKELHGRALGVASAVMISLRGLNSIVSATWIDLASPKMMLTDFATAIGVAVFTLLILKWIKEPSKNHLAVWAGGTLGMTIMLRTHVLLLLPILLLYIWISLRPRWGNLVIGSLLLIFGMLTATTPWDLRNQKNDTPMFYVYYSRIQEVLRARYGIQGDTYQPADPLVIPNIQTSHAKSEIRNDARQRISEWMVSDFCDNKVCKITNHFFHNFIASFLFLPTRLTFDDLWNTIKISTPYWDNKWRGEGVDFSEGFFILFNLMAISLGFGAMWKRNHAAALVPVIIFFAYIITNALALTSGGRYVVPVDWIICVYYLTGLMQVVIWVLHRADVVSISDPLFLENKNELTSYQFSSQFSKIVPAFVMIFMIGSLIPAAELPFEQRYQVRSEDDILAMLEEKGMFEKTTVNKDDLSAFLSDPQADILVGRLLYPRYYHSNEGEQDRHYPYVRLDYSRLVFIIIGPFDGGRQNVIVAGEKPKFDLQASDVVVVGCKNEKYLDGLAVFVLSRPDFVYMHMPVAKWKCQVP